MSSLGRGASMAQSIISMCRRTWTQERRIGVLLRAVEPPLSVWDCVPESIIDSHLKDAFEYHSDQRDYLLFYAIPGSSVLRSIRRLDGYRASPLVLKSLHFFSHQKDEDAYNFPPESDFTDDSSESEYGEDSFISRESTLSPTPISELDDSDIHSTTQTYNSKSEDEAELHDEMVRRKPQQWTEYPESEAFEVCIAPLQQSALDLNDEASSPEPRILPPAHQPYTESDGDLKDDEPLKASSTESRLPSPVYQSSPESDDDLKDDEPFETSSSELQLLSPVHSSYMKSDDGLKDDEPIEANNPETQTFSPVHQSSPESDDDLKDDEPLEATSSRPRILSPVHPYYTESDDDLKDDEPLKANNSEPRLFSQVHQSSPESDDDLKDDGPLEAINHEPRPFSGVHQFYPVFNDDEEDEPLTAEIPFYPVHKFYPQPDDGQKDDKPLGANNPEPRPFSGVHQFYPVFDDDEEDEPLTAEKFEPQPSYPVHKFYPQPDDGQKDDKPLDANKPEPRPFSGVHQFYPVFHDDEEDEPLTAENLEPRPFCPVHKFYPQPDDDLKDDEPLEANNHEPQPFSGVHQFDPVFDDDEEREPLSAESLEPRQLHPAHQFYSEYDYRQRDNGSPEPDSSEPQQFSPEHQLHSRVYDPQPPQMEILRPEPIRKHAKHKLILEPELFEDWFVDMSEIIFIDEEATSPEESILATPSPEPQTPSPVPKPEFVDQASLGTHGPKPQRIVHPVHQFHPRLYEPQAGLELDHEGPESLEIWNLYY